MNKLHSCLVLVLLLVCSWSKISTSQTTLDLGLWEDSSPYEDWSLSDEFTNDGTIYHGQFALENRLNRTFLIPKPSNDLTHTLVLNYKLLFACSVEIQDTIHARLLFDNQYQTSRTHVKTYGTVEINPNNGAASSLVTVCTSVSPSSNTNLNIWHGSFSLTFDYNRDDFMSSINTGELFVAFNGEFSHSITNEYWAVSDISIEISKESTDTPTERPSNQPTMRPIEQISSISTTEESYSEVDSDTGDEALNILFESTMDGMDNDNNNGGSINGTIYETIDPMINKENKKDSDEGDIVLHYLDQALDIVVLPVFYIPVGICLFTCLVALCQNIYFTLKRPKHAVVQLSKTGNISSDAILVVE